MPLLMHNFLKRFCSDFLTSTLDFHPEIDWLAMQDSYNGLIL